MTPSDIFASHIELVDDAIRDLVAYIAVSEMSNHYKLSLVSRLAQILDLLPMGA